MTRQDNVSFLDQARGVAILCVFLYHALFQPFRRDDLDWNGWFRNFDAPSDFLELYPISWGWCGVAIFFVISGFCIHLSYSRMREPSFTEFFLRRWFRIYPPFVIALLFFAFFYPHTRVPLQSFYGIGELASHLLLVHNLDLRTEFGINVSFWSIAVEFQLYLLYPLLVILASKVGWKRVLLITGCVEIGLRLSNDIYLLAGRDISPAWLDDSPLYFWFSWTLGAAVADAYLKGKQLPLSLVPPWVWMLLLVAADLFKPLAPFNFTFAALATAAVIVRLLAPREPKPAQTPSRLWAVISRQLELAGICSYSIYLIHHPIVESWPQVVRFLWPTAPGHPLLYYVCCLTSWAVILPVSWALYRYVEQPSIALGKHVIDARRKRRAMLAMRPQTHA